jgi:hypothetical protein
LSKRDCSNETPPTVPNGAAATASLSLEKKKQQTKEKNKKRQAAEKAMGMEPKAYSQFIQTEANKQPPIPLNAMGRKVRNLLAEAEKK